MGLQDIKDSSDSKKKSEQVQQAAAQQRQKRVNKFYKDLKAKTQNPYDDSIVTSDGERVLDAAGASSSKADLSLQHAPAFSDIKTKEDAFKAAAAYLAGTQLALDSSAFSNAKDILEATNAYLETKRKELYRAMGNADVNTVRLILGPDLATHALEYRRQSREQLWKWIEAKINLVIAQAKARAMYEYVKTNHFPNVIDESQERDLKKQIKQPLAQLDSDEIVKLWQLGDEATTQLIREKFQSELQKAKQDIDTQFLRNLPSSLYDLNNEVEVKKLICEECHALQQAVTLQEAAVNEQSMWQAFEGELQTNQLYVDPEAIKALKKSRLFEVPLFVLSQPNISGMDESDVDYNSTPSANTSEKSLIEVAIENYYQDLQSAIRIQGSAKHVHPGYLQIIEILLQHGDRPSQSFYQTHAECFTWDVQSLIYKYTEATTELAERKRQELIKMAESHLNPTFVMNTLQSIGVTSLFPIFSLTPSNSQVELENSRRLMSVLSSNKEGLVLNAALADVRLLPAPWAHIIDSGVSLGNQRAGLFSHATYTAPSDFRGAGNSDNNANSAHASSDVEMQEGSLFAKNSRGGGYGAL